MITKEKKEGVEVLILSRKVRIWECSECKKEYEVLPTQCSCGAPDKVFLEKDSLLKDGERKYFVVLENLIYGSEEIKKGKKISLLEKDPAVKSMQSRKLIKAITNVKTGV